MKKPLIFLICFVCFFPVVAQKEANVWVFEYGAGIDFNYDRFIPFNVSGMKQAGGSASICDKETGRLLFYTEGRNVWDRNFRKMPNGAGLRGGYATTQAALITPYPGSDQLFYLFTTKSYSDSTDAWMNLGDTEFTGCYFSVIDMGLNGGLGDVIKGKKNVLLLERSTEKLTAVPHGNGRDYWLVTHEWGTDRFVVFPITMEGVGAPRYFSIGEAYGHYEARGYLIPSPNGKMIASAPYSGDSWLSRPLELYDFDPSAGTITNRRELGRYPNLYGLSFSPDNSKLYFTYYDQYENSITYGGLYQMDLEAGETEDIISSATELYFLHETGTGNYDTIAPISLQLGPDGRLYTEATGVYLNPDEPEQEKRRIFYIDQPDLKGWLSSPDHRDFDKPIRTDAFTAFPNFIQSYFNGLKPSNNFFHDEKCATAAIQVYPNPTDGRLYLDGIAVSCHFPLWGTVYNGLGQELKSFEILVDPPRPIDITGYAPGVYFLKLHSPYQYQMVKVVKK